MLFRHLLGGDAVIVDPHAARLRVRAGGGQHCLACVDAGYGGAPGRHAFGENAATAAHVENRSAGKSGGAGDKFEPQRVDVVERLEGALRIPPARRQRFELGDLQGVGITVRHDHRSACADAIALRWRSMRPGPW